MILSTTSMFVSCDAGIYYCWLTGFIFHEVDCKWYCLLLCVISWNGFVTRLELFVLENLQRIAFPWIGEIQILFRSLFFHFLFFFFLKNNFLMTTLIVNITKIYTYYILQNTDNHAWLLISNTYKSKFGSITINKNVK